MKENNNSDINTDKNNLENQEKVSAEATKNFKINLSCGIGITNNIITLYSYDYNKLKAKLQGFTAIDEYYNDKTNVSGREITMPREEAIKRARKSAKEKSEWFIAGVFEGNIRRTEKLKYRNAIVLDIDDYDGNISGLEEQIKIDLANYTYLAYSTASHTPDKPKIRIILPTSSNIVTADYDSISRAFIDTLGFKSAVDAASFKANQCMFFSSNTNIIGLPEGVQIEKYQPWFLDNLANLLNPEKYRIKSSNTQTKSGRSVELKIVDDESYIDPSHTREGYIPETEDEINLTLKLTEHELLDKLQEYSPTGLSYNEWCEVLMALHHYYKGSENGLAIADKWSKQDKSKYQGLSEIKSKWKSFGNKSSLKPITFLTVIKRIKNKKYDEFENTIHNCIKKLTKKFRDEELKSVIRKIAENCTEEESDCYLQDIKKETGLGIGKLRTLFTRESRIMHYDSFKLRKDYVYPFHTKLPAQVFKEYAEDKPPKATIENFNKLIKCYGIKIVRNVVSKKDVIVLPKDEYLEETADAARLVRIESLITDNNFAGGKRIGAELCTEVASLNPYNPISEWYRSKEWDGTDRLQIMCNTIKTPEHYQKEHKEHFLRKWFISFIAAMEEKKGVFTKGVLIFQGEQSIGKTSWFKKLLPNPVSEYFLEGATLDPSNKDSKATVTSHGIVELGEADSTMKKDIAAIKAFLTSNKDVFRPSYGRVDNKLPRRTVFCASVNDNEYLVDPTGNSRFWTIPVTSLDYKHEIDMQQFWAQILTIYESGEQWWLDVEWEKILNAYNEEHLKTCPYTELLIERYEFPSENEPEINSDDPSRPSQWLSATDIYRSLEMKANETAGSREVARALSKLGAARSKHNRKFLVRDHKDYEDSSKDSIFSDDLE